MPDQFRVTNIQNDGNINRVILRGVNNSDGRLITMIAPRSEGWKRGDVIYVTKLAK